MENKKTNRTTATIRIEIEKAVKDFIEHRNGGKASLSIKDTEKLSELEKEFAHIAMLEHFAKCAVASDKMHSVLRSCSYTVLSHKDSVSTAKEVDKNGNAQEVVKFDRKIVEKKRFVSLRAYDAYCNKEFGSYASRDFEWIFKVEDAARVLTQITSGCVGFAFDTNSYRVSKNAQSIYKPDDFKPDTIIDTLQGIVDDIIYDEKDGANRYAVGANDAQFVMKTFTGFGGVSKVKTANKGGMDNIILSVLLHLVTNTGYEVVYPKIKAQAN